MPDVVQVTFSDTIATLGSALGWFWTDGDGNAYDGDSVIGVAPSTLQVTGIANGDSGLPPNMLGWYQVAPYPAGSGGSTLAPFDEFPISN